jgi:bifunctional UDP-N-acetylglucosamine pyrophosphorylase/glucosamine-1-phosphate N-acetyltransferase
VSENKSAKNSQPESSNNDNTSSAKEQPKESWTVIILAAGKGTRMASPLPKVLHPVAGRPMIERIIQVCKKSGIQDIRVVVGHGLNLVKSIVEPLGVQVHTQVQQLGTADAVKASNIETIEGNTLIINGDHPLIQEEDLTGFMKSFVDSKSDLSVVTTKLKKPGSFGRIVRSLGQLKAIVEAKDASADTLKINEINTGIYLVRGDVLNDYLPKIRNNNSQKEYYLTDLVSLAIEDQLKVTTIAGKRRVSHGVNNQIELSQATRYIYLKKMRSLLEAGVVILNPHQTYIEDTVKVGAGTVIYPGTFLRGQTDIGSFCVIESNCFISDSTIEHSVQIKAGSYIEKSVVKSKASLGPYARLRPETYIGEEAHIGNFVELKKVIFGAKSKAGHLSYLGDAEIGEDTNIGCGTITCNYAVDKKKYKTKIGSHVFVGSDSQFVAPVEIGDHAVIASGSTITENVPERALGVARGKQYVKENYVKKEADVSEESQG